MRALIPVLFIFSLGCSRHVNVTITNDGSGLTTARACFIDPGFIAFCDVLGGDTATVTRGAESLELALESNLLSESLVATFDGETPAGTTVNVVASSNDQGTREGDVSMPEPFTILSPRPGDIVTPGQILVEWIGGSPADTFELNAFVACPNGPTGLVLVDREKDSGSFQFSEKQFKDISIIDTCDLTITLERANEGELDEGAFADSLKAVQSRSVELFIER
jgi:hypothetical protein